MTLYNVQITRQDIEKATILRKLLGRVQHESYAANAECQHNPVCEALRRVGFKFHHVTQFNVWTMSDRFIRMPKEIRTQMIEWFKGNQMQKCAFLLDTEKETAPLVKEVRGGR